MLRAEKNSAVLSDVHCPGRYCVKNRVRFDLFEFIVFETDDTEVAHANPESTAQILNNRSGEVTVKMFVDLRNRVKKPVRKKKETIFVGSNEPDSAC